MMLCVYMFGQIDTLYAVQECWFMMLVVNMFEQTDTVYTVQEGYL